MTVYAEAPVDVQRRLLVSLARLRLSMTRDGHHDTCIDLCTALEALVGDYHRKEFVERVAWTYAAARDRALAVEDPIRKTVRRFYDHRCRIVHGKIFEEQPLLTQAAESILIECIKWIVWEQNVPNWRAAVRMSPATHRTSRRTDRPQG